MSWPKLNEEHWMAAPMTIIIEPINYIEVSSNVLIEMMFLCYYREDRARPC